MYNRKQIATHWLMISVTVCSPDVDKADISVDKRLATETADHW